MKDFVDNLDPVNADADAADGFVWRLQSEEGDATDIAVFGDEWLIINMSVWRDADALTAYMYQGRHREMLARRREFFERVQEAMVTLWWVPAGHRPTVAEAESRLLHLRTNGPTPYAFTLRKLFPAQGAEAGGRPGAAGRPGVLGVGRQRIGLRISARTWAVVAAALSRSISSGSVVAVAVVSSATAAPVLPSPQAQIGTVSLVSP